MKSFLIWLMLIIPTVARAQGGVAAENLSVISEKINVFYTWSIGVGISLAIIMLMYAGYIMITSSGDPQKVGFAKEVIVGALSGLALLAGARLVLNLLS